MPKPHFLRGLAPIPLLALALHAQCDPPAPRSFTTGTPWTASFFYGDSGGPGKTLNLFFDLEVKATVTVDRLWIPTYDQQPGSGFPPDQTGNIAEVRVYLVEGSWAGLDEAPQEWGLRVPQSGLPECAAELTITAWPGRSPIQNFKDAAGNPAPWVLEEGHYGVCLEIVPTSWVGTASLPGQTNVPLLNPGGVHVLGIHPDTPRVVEDEFLVLRNDAIQGTGWQGVDASGALGPIAPNPGTSVRDNINLDIDYVPGAPGPAVSVPFGQGCYDAPRAVYETFPSSVSIDLSNTAWTFAFQADGSGGHYTITPGGPAFDLATATAQGVDITQQPPTVSLGNGWDDGSLVRTLSTALFPAGFPFPGGTCAAVTINYNGKVLLGATTSNAFVDHGAGGASVDSFRAGLPQIAGLRADYAQHLGGSRILVEEPSPRGGIRVTWSQMDRNPWSGSPSSFQLELLPGGDVHLAYGSARLSGFDNHGLVGFSPGGGAPLGPPVDWSAITAHTTGSGARPPRLRLAGPPVAQGQLVAVVDRLASGTAAPFGGFLVMGMVPAQPGISLASYGAPGCASHVDLGQVVLTDWLTNTGTGELRWTWPVPVFASGLSAFVQAATFAPTPHNPAGITLSNALCLRFGP